MKVWQPLEAKATLFEASAFRVTILIFGSIALTYAAVNFYASPAPDSPTLSVTYFEYLYKMLSRPLLIGGLSLPLLGLIASHLRSIQTKDQIEAQERQIGTQVEQNLFSNYSKHREFFTDFFKDEALFSRESSLSGKAHELHALLYPNAKTGPLSPSSQNIKSYRDIKRSTKHIRELCQKVDWKTRQPPEDLDEAVETHTQLLCESLKLRKCFYNEDSKLSSVATRITRLTVTHHDLHSAATFFTVNDCSREFETMYENLVEAQEHLRQVLEHQFYLAELLDHFKKAPNQPISDHLESKLREFLRTDPEDKLAYIYQDLDNHPQLEINPQEIEKLIQ